MSSSNSSGLVGQSVKRVEDDRLLRGNGKYVADINPAGVLHAVFLRSPMAHATITSIDTIARGGAQPLKFEPRPNAVRFSVGPGLLPGDRCRDRTAPTKWP